MIKNQDYKCKNIKNNKLNIVKEKSLENAEEEKLVDLFKTIGEKTRSKILLLLTIVPELFVCEIIDLLKMEQSAVSHQLRILRNKDLVKSRKVGKLVYYSLKDEHVKDLFKIAIEHIREEMETSI
ncbi:MAG TPA: helix-turn-helix transcriptional regulator [Acholeplasmataceae bacterium]|nr:helix-turn-helix transcriptional regulator [Acholeplasmataceae bacterium]